MHYYTGSLNILGHQPKPQEVEVCQWNLTSFGYGFGPIYRLFYLPDLVFDRYH